MIEPASRPAELDRHRDAARDARSQAKEQAEPESIADAEHQRVRHRPRKQPQRTVLPTQQVISKVQTTQHIKAYAGNADARDCMMVHYFVSAEFLDIRPGKSSPVLAKSPQAR